MLKRKTRSLPFHQKNIWKLRGEVDLVAAVAAVAADTAAAAVVTGSRCPLDGGDGAIFLDTPPQ